MSRSCRALTAWLISFVCLFELVHGIVKTRASCTSSSGFIVNSQSDIDSGPIHGCTTLYGDIVMDNAAGNFSFLESGVVNVHGSIYLRNNSGVEYLDLADILSISTSFTALNAAKLKFLSFDSSLAQLPYISLQGLPNVGSVYVSNVTRMVSLSIVDTGVDSLSFGVLKTIKDITFLNNFQMDSTTLGFDVLTNITGNFIAMNNSQPERGISMRIPYLSYMNNATWDSLWELDLEELVQVNDSLSISNSQSLMTQIQLPLLTSVGGSFVVRNNPGIITIAATGLQHVGDLVVENNAKLSDLAQMRELEDAKSITLSGYGFNEGTTEDDFPVLERVMGNVNVSAPGFNCKTFENLKNSGDINGTLDCNGSGNATASSSHGLSTGAKAGIGVGAAIGGLVLIVVLYLCCANKKQPQHNRDLPAFAQRRYNFQPART